MTVVTNMKDPIPIYHRIKNSGLIPLTEIGDSEEKKVKFESIKDYGKVFINGNWLGLHEDIPSLVKKLRSLRRLAVINIETSISYNIFDNEMRIYTDGGRCSRKHL